MSRRADTSGLAATNRSYEAAKSWLQTPEAQDLDLSARIHELRERYSITFNAAVRLAQRATREHQP